MTTKNKKIVTTEEVRVEFGGGRLRFRVTVPAGHAVEDHGYNPDGSLNLFATPYGLGLTGMELHDAVHYGIRIPASKIKEISVC